MRINADFTRRASVHAAATPWVPSPVPGVERRMLDRVGGEVARATSIVRYAPGSNFSPHVHDGGEEFLVLEGVFQDEHGDFPTGTYVRNPPGSSHAPRSEPGCTILVKLWQFDPHDRAPVRLRTDEGNYGAAGDRRDVEILPLHRDPRETVALERWAPGANIDLALPGGGEIFVLEGGFTEASERFGRWSWLRLPAGSRLEATAAGGGAAVWTKSGHLASPRPTPCTS